MCLSPYNTSRMSDAPEPSRATRDLSVLAAWRLLITPTPRRVLGPDDGDEAGPRPGIGRYAGLLVVIGLLNLSAITVIVASTVPVPIIAAVAALLHLAVIPGMLLAFAVAPPGELDIVEWLVLGLGLGFLLLVGGGLVLALAPVRLVPINVVMWTAGLTLVVAIVAFSRATSWRLPSIGSRANLLCAALVVLVAAGLRLPGLGYSEFQGDETEVILRAAGVVQNLPDAIFYHGKGPGEVVVVAVQYGLLGAINEGMARLPFAVAGIGGVLAFYVVARRLLGTPGATAGALLLATNGYLVAFSRITQYQSIVLLLGTLALWCAVRWSQGGGRVWPVLAGTLAAGAALAHYDALFVLPPIALAAYWRVGWRGLIDFELLAPWRRGALIGAGLLALFFVPYLDNPLFALATGRIEDRVGAGFPHNNLPGIIASGTLYLGTAFPLLVAGLIVCGLIALLVRRPGTPTLRVWLLALVWAAVPLLFYAVVARKPGTHVHVATSGLLLLAGAGFGSLWALVRPRPVADTLSHALPRLNVARVGACAALAVLLAGGLALVGTYLVPIYLHTTAEIVRADRVNLLPLAWRPPGGLPPKERFGFPYQGGWNAVTALFANGTLSGSYDTNEQIQVTYWYTRGQWRCSVNPRYYLIAENVQDEIETPRRTIQAEYRQIGTVTVAGQPKMRVYERGAPGGTTGGGQQPEPAVWAVEDVAAPFRRLGVPSLDPGPWARGVMARDSTPLAVSFGDDIDLLGYQVYAEDPRPGGVVRVDLFWLPHVTSDEGYRIDAQVGRESRIGDGSGPACDKTGADKSWVAGQPFTQRLSIPIAASAPVGHHPLLVSVSQLGDGGGALTPTGGPATPTGEPMTTDALVQIGEIEVLDASSRPR